MQLKCNAFAAKLKAACAAENAQFYIVYHINPDGDCIGSAYALALLLRRLGAKSAVIGRDPVPAQFRDMTDPIENDILDGSAQYIGVDCKDRARTGDVLKQKEYAFWIDHHGSPDEEAAFEYVRPEHSACSELVLAVAEALGITPDTQMAVLLYTALVTDTSCFRTSATNAMSFQAAAKLAECGIDPYAIGRKHAMVKAPSRLKIEQTIFGGMTLDCDGQLVTGLVLLDDLKRAGIAEVNGPEMQNINALLEVIESAKITVLIREYPADNPEGQTRFSIKTTDRRYSARDLAMQFGGGGHPQAAGGFMRETPARARELLIEACKKLF